MCMMYSDVRGLLPERKRLKQRAAQSFCKVLIFARFYEDFERSPRGNAKQKTNRNALIDALAGSAADPFIVMLNGGKCARHCFGMRAAAPADRSRRSRRRLRFRQCPARARL